MDQKTCCYTVITSHTGLDGSVAYSKEKRALKLLFLRVLSDEGHSTKNFSRCLFQISEFNLLDPLLHLSSLGILVVLQDPKTKTEV